MKPNTLQGLWCATLSPLDKRGAFDAARLANHAQRLFAAGVDGIAPFGTTGEGQSFSVAERRAGLDALIAAGIAPQRIWPPPAAPRCRTRSSSRATRLPRDAPVRWCCRRSFSRM
jgi:hypothetical protein